MQKYILQINPLLKETKDPSIYNNSITNVKFQKQAKISSFKKPRIKTDLLHLGAKIH